MITELNPAIGYEDTETLDTWRVLIQVIGKKPLKERKSPELDENLEKIRRLDPEVPIKSRCKLKDEKVEALEEAVARHKLKDSSSQEEEVDTSTHPTYSL